MSLLDTPKPPIVRGARVIRPLDEPRDEALSPPASKPIDYKAIAMNNKAASLRALLHDNPDGLNYDELCRHTGIARDKIGAHVAGLITTGDVKPFEIPGRGRIFKFTGDPHRIGPRTATQAPSTPEVPSFGADAARKAAESLPPPPRSSVQSRGTESAAAPATPTTAPHEGAGQGAASDPPVEARTPAPPAQKPPAEPPKPAAADPRPDREPEEPTIKVVPLKAADAVTVLLAEAEARLTEACQTSSDPLVLKWARTVRTLSELREEFERTPA